MGSVMADVDRLKGDVGRPSEPLTPTRRTWADFAIQEVVAGDNLLRCQRISQPSGAVVTGDIYVARPPLMRSPWPNAALSRPYEVDEVLTAIAGDTGLTDPSSARVRWADANTAGRGTGPIWARVTGSSGGTGNQWAYTATQVERMAGGWAAVSGGVSIAGMLNATEANNTGSGVEGYGGDLTATGESTFTLLPIRGEPVVMCWPTLISGTIYWTFAQPNFELPTCV